LGAGDHFGEMAFFSGDRRSASVAALEDTVLFCIDRNIFLEVYEADPDIAAKIDRILARRNEELTIRETLIEHPGAKGKELHIGIKGDPSLRESVFSRERFESVVDKYLSQLQPQLYELLFNRCAYEVSIHFNSGELHIKTVFDPFNDEIHPANKLVNMGYVERHFQTMDYEEKARMVKRAYEFLGNDPGFDRLPGHARADLRTSFGNWEPVSPIKITRVLAKLPLLRMIPNLYLRNFTISTIRDAIRMQFNCDGAHIINADDYETFLEQNLPLDELTGCKPGEERRIWQRRDVPQQASSKFGERRMPPGRRQEDWAAHIRLMTAEAGAESGSARA